MTTMIPTLAAGDWTGIAIFLAILAISGIGQALGKLNKKLQDKDKQPSQAGEAEPKVNLDELAARRRAELMAEAQRRRTQQAPPTQASPAKPMTMAERMAKARSKAAQRATATQQRIAQLRQAQTNEAQRAQQAELERRRQAALRQQQQRAAQRPSAPQRPPTARPAEHAPPRRPQPQQQAKPPLQPHYAVEHEEVHQLVKVAPPLEVARTTPVLGSGFSLRQAMIWKEILDKPVGLRGMDYDFPT